MKVKIEILLMFVFSTLFVSCEKDNGNMSLKQESSNTSQRVIVILEGVFTKNDNFSIFYNKEVAEWFDGSHVDRYVYGSPLMQKVEFYLPKNLKPKQLRLDLGTNPNQGVVTIKNITVKYNNDSINGDYGEFMKYFNILNQVSYDEKNFVYNLPIGSERYDPYIVANKDFEKKLAVLLSKTKKTNK